LLLLVAVILVTAGVVFRVTLHVQASSDMSLHDAHVLGGKVKGAIRAAEPQVDAVLVHLEPFEEKASTPE
jgi:divalent metal cation (Fe/Co/Zn/Cd) transporter